MRSAHVSEPQAASRYLYVHPQLHGSGFGNQVGMLLQHIALAAFSGRTLVLPDVHQPREHQQHERDALTIPADEIFNLTALEPLARVLSRRQVQLAADLSTEGRLTFSSLGVKQRLPLRMLGAPLPPLVAAAQMLRAQMACEEGGGHCVVRHVSYCHLASCRARTRRACRRLSTGCSRLTQRLPNNYLFAHRLGPLVCGTNDPTTYHGAGDGALADAVKSDLLAYQRQALARLALSDVLRVRAAAYAHALGDGYMAVHARLRDVKSTTGAPASDTANAEYNKGLTGSELPSLLASLMRTIHRNASKGESVRTLYVASNRPGTVQRLRPTITAALAHAGFGSVALRSWYDLSRPSPLPESKLSSVPALPEVDEPGLDGLRAALVEHELCTRAPRGFAGSPFSTWANLIGARRWAAGHAADRAYLNLHNGAVVPACAPGWQGQGQAEQTTHNHDTTLVAQS